MSNPCGTHPNRTSTGACVRCGQKTCPLCVVDVDGTIFCSILCFTEQTLAAKGKTLRVKNKPDPLASVDFREPTLVLNEAEADPPDDSSVMMSAAESEDRSETSILDMSSPRKLDDSSVAPVEGHLKDPTSILGMPAWMDEPPATETPLPMLLPGTRRSTITSACVFHSDTPAVVRCSACGDSICTMCIADEEHGGRCSPACRREVRRRKRRRLAIGAAGLLIAALVAWAAVPSSQRTKPAMEGAEGAKRIAAAEERERSMAERARLETAAREEARARVEARKREEEAAVAAAAAAKAKAEAEARTRAEELAKAEADAREALAKAEAEAKAKADALAKAEAAAREEAAKAAAALAAKEEARRKAEAESAARAKAAFLAAEASAKAAADAKAREEAEARAKAEADARAKAAAAAEAKAKEEAEAKAAAKALATEAALQKASLLIREATPEFCALSESAADDAAHVAQIDALSAKLSSARSEYQALLADLPALDRRIALLDDLLSALRTYRSRCAPEK